MKKAEMKSWNWSRVCFPPSKKGSDYFTKNFQVKKSKTKIRNIIWVFLFSFFGIKIVFKLEAELCLGLILQ